MMAVASDGAGGRWRGRLGRRTQIRKAEIRRNKRRTSMPATGSAASYTKKGGLRILKILLDRREVVDVERGGNGGEERYENEV